MKIKNSFYLAFIVLSFKCMSMDNQEKFYSLSYLRDYHTVRKDLKKVGFKPIIIKTSDNLKLSGLFLSRPNATCNVIINAGWLPGRKEGMATFYDLLPEHCNILLFDARGHGESEGSLLWKLWRYGVDEYKDIIGAITWIHNHNTLPIFIVGMCSGAFNAAHACAYLEENNLTRVYNVKGLIFDSGWASVNKIIMTAPIAGINKRLRLFFTLIYKNKKQINKNLFYKMGCYCAKYLTIWSNYLCASPLAFQYDHITNLSYRIKNITIPIFFIHSHEDVYADFTDAKNISDLAQNKKCWWIAKSSHAKHHLIHKNTYKEKIIAFIEHALHIQ